MTPFETEQSPEEGEQPAPSSREMYAGQSVAQLLVTAVLVVVAFSAGWFGNAYANRANVATGEQTLVLQAWNDINQNYVVTSAINQKKMAYAAINAMVNSLGDTGHSRFETPEQYAQENTSLSGGSTVGIGVYISGGGSTPLTIEATIPGSSAAKAGLLPGDQIIAVDGKSVVGMTFDQVHPLIVGKSGTKVTLTIKRTSVSPPATLNVSLTRAPFTPPNVVSYIIPGLNIADIQILSFDESQSTPSVNTDTQLRVALKAALAQHVSGIILDLRDNPGGYLDQAVAVASEFIPAGPNKNVLIDVTRSTRHVFPVSAGGLATNLPLVVLVNHGTASAAEIVAGAIAVNRPSVHVVGVTTFGTGTILLPFQLADGSVILLGTEEWLLPNGQTIYHKGFTPDQQVALPASVAPVSPLAAQEAHLTAQQIRSSGDAQLNKAIQDLTGQ